jgi:putative membrane protein
MNGTSLNAPILNFFAIFIQNVKGHSPMKHPGPGTSHGRSFFDYLVLAAKGFCMGASDVVPGVSGGTMAFILGIYEELINAIRSFDLKSIHLLGTLKIADFLERTGWPFLLALGVGILTAIFTLSRGLGWLLQNRPVLIWSFFLGLILASVLSVSRRIGRWHPSTWISLVAAIFGTYFLVGIVPVSTPNDPWFLFLSGAIAICAMILPGISGSFVLVLLGKYQYVLEAVNTRDFFVLFIVAGGAVVGIVAFSRLLGWLLERHHDLMVAVLTGLMLGSLRKVWPWKVTQESMVGPHGKLIPLVQSNVLPSEWSTEVMMALCLMGVGLLAVLVLDRLGSRGSQ